ncbi:hypothetical protein QN277_000792 [Acacia crassicarpa]|uniref:glutamate carboxypeptidase II n=1 Tax=Acacia crassicarpa TaxID=499986 RepID=A0AAE1N5X4_9FABA|nr:hypothetical protein QN277_000792 [Acacia crassicarpa]
MITPTATAATFLALITTSFLFLFVTPPSKSTYHSLFISDSLADNTSISHHLRTLTRRPHSAGSEANAEAAAYVISVLTSSDIPSHIASYKVLLTYPLSRSLLLINPPPKQPTNFTLRQETYDGDPYADVEDEVLPTFHAYAKSGTVIGPVVYVNYGRVVDYLKLKEIGVNVSGTVVLARYGKIFRGDIVKNACEEGAIGAVIYSDRKDYGGAGEARWFPDGRWLPPSGVQVGSVHKGVGDPTTPGWASRDDDGDECERLSEDEVEQEGDVLFLPSLPVSAADGEEILRSIGGPVASDDWQGDKDAPTYRVGPGPGILNLSYTGEQILTKIDNVVGVIKGAEEPDRFVILGNHRDAWTFGAVDPNSGTAALLEIAQRLGKLQRRGWKPRRTIILCSWDAEEYGLTGSTEWVEENREILASRAVAYLNADTAVVGPGFYARATPQLDELIKRATQQVKDPENSSLTVYEAWAGSGSSPMLGRLGGGGSDFKPFLQHVGIPAADISFGKDYPVYHSLYDNFIWMEKFGDPKFQRHVAEASVWGLVALWLADEEFLPFDYLSYAKELQISTKNLESEISNNDINLSPIFKSIRELEEAAKEIEYQRKAIEESRGWIATAWKKDQLRVRELNDRLMMAERAFTDRDGLFGMTWHKHLIYGPTKHNNYGSQSFPGIDDAVNLAKELKTEESWNRVQHEVWRVSRVIRQASLVLKGQPT